MRYLFPLVEGVTNERLQVVHPLMQRDVNKIMEITKSFPVAVILFGSSLTINCRSNSDIDIAITTPKEDKGLFLQVVAAIKEQVESPTDIVYCNELVRDGSMWEELRRTGYVLQNNLKEV